MLAAVPVQTGEMLAEMLAAILAHSAGTSKRRTHQVILQANIQDAGKRTCGILMLDPVGMEPMAQMEPIMAAEVLAAEAAEVQARPEVQAYKRRSRGKT